MSYSVIINPIDNRTCVYNTQLQAKIMVKLGIIEAGVYKNNNEAITKIANILEKLGRKNTDIVCLPEQWLKENHISDYNTEFSIFSKIAKEHSMSIIPGAFYQQKKQKSVISAPIIGPNGDIIGIQEKIHPFDYEKNIVSSGKQVKIFNTSCKFGIVICYDMVFPHVVNSLVKKGAEVIFAPSRIVKSGVIPWQLYVQVRALENRVPILAANIRNNRFGGNSIIVDLEENNKIILPKITKIKEQEFIVKNFNLKKYEKSRKSRFADARKFI